MQHLLVVCYPRRKSFIQLAAAAYREEVQILGHQTVLRDLYRDGFDPVLEEHELFGSEHPTVPRMVRREQAHMAAAGVIAFFYPLWRALMPAMLKGYFDRVLSAGFAYDLADEDLMPRLPGKKAVIFSSSSTDTGYLRDSGQWQALRLIEKEHILLPCGIELLDHVHFSSIGPDLSVRTIDKHMERVRGAVQKSWGDIPAARG